MKEYAVVQQIVDSNGNVVHSEINDDGFLVYDTAKKVADSFQKRNDEEHCDLDLPLGYRYKYVVEEV